MRKGSRIAYNGVGPTGIDPDTDCAELGLVSLKPMPMVTQKLVALTVSCENLWGHQGKKRRV